MIVYYDSFCKLCTNSSTIWKKLDWRNKLTFHSFRDLDNYPVEMEKSLHIQKGKKWYKGYSAIIQIAKTLPLLWVFLPFLYLFKLIGIGDMVYKVIAKNRKLVPVNQCKNKDSCQITPNSR